MTHPTACETRHMRTRRSISALRGDSVLCPDIDHSKCSHCSWERGHLALVDATRAGRSRPRRVRCPWCEQVLDRMRRGAGSNLPALFDSAGHVLERRTDNHIYTPEMNYLSFLKVLTVIFQRSVFYLKIKHDLDARVFIVWV